MAMHPAMIAALQARAKRCHLVKVEMPDHTIRWTDGGVVRWDGEVYRTKDATYGSLNAIGTIVDGIEVDAAPVTLSIAPPSLASLDALARSDAQGGRVEIYLAALVGGQVQGEPYLLYIGELDQPSLPPGPERILEYEIISAEARALRVSEEQVQSDAFHRLCFPGELGQQYATDGTKLTYWREDEPTSALGVLTGRGLENTNKAIQFTYDPNAPLAFPFGRCGIAGGEMRYRVGYGPTNRYQSVVGTIAASGPIHALISTSFDDQITSFDGNGRATNGDHAGFMWCQFLPGAQPSPALTSPTGPEANSGPAPGWTSAHKLSGYSCFMWTGKENSKKNEFNGGLPKPLFVVDGLRGYDPLVAGSAIDDVETWSFIDEGCRVALNWVIGRWMGPSGGGTYGVPYRCVPVGGIAAPLELIDVEAFADAAEVADALGLKFAGVPYSNEARIEVLEDMLAVSGARRSRKAGRISCVSLAAPVAPSRTITEADTASRPTVVLAGSRLDRINTGIPEFWSSQHRWEVVPADPVTNPAWVSADGGRNTDTYTYRFSPNKNMASQLCYLDMARERAGVTVTQSFQSWMLCIEPGKAIEWDTPETLLSGVKCRVWKRSYDPTTALVKIEFRQDLEDQVYADAASIVGTIPTPSDPSIRPSRVVDPPSEATMSVLGDEVLFSWRNGEARYFRTLFYVGADADFDHALQVGSKGGEPGETQSATHALSRGTWFCWLVTRSGGAGAYDLSAPVFLGSVTIDLDVVPIIPADVTATPTLTAASTVQPDGTQISRLSGDWPDADNASTYIVELDRDGTVDRFEVPASEFRDRLVLTGGSYRFRVTARSRTGHTAVNGSPWSATVAAGGDTTPPGPVTGGFAIGGARAVHLGWINPPDSDYSHLRLYRHPADITPLSNVPTTATLLSARATGTDFTDSPRPVGVVGHYWAVSYDQSGNPGPVVKLGSAAARFVSVTGGDVDPFDRSGNVSPTSFAVTDLIRQQIEEAAYRLAADLDQEEAAGRNQADIRDRLDVVATINPVTRRATLQDNVITDSGLATEEALAGLQAGIENGSVQPLIVSQGGKMQVDPGLQVSLQPQTYVLEAGDGDEVTFPVSYVVPPVVVQIGSHGLSALTSSGDVHFTAPENVTGSGFTGRNRRRNPGSGGTPTVRVDDGSANQTPAPNTSAQIFYRNKLLSGVSGTGKYVAKITVATTTGPTLHPRSMTVALEGRKVEAGAFTQIGQITVESSSSTTDTEYTDHEIVGTLAWSDWPLITGSGTDGYEYRVRVIAGYIDYVMCLRDFLSVEYTENVGATDAVDEAVEGNLLYLVIPQSIGPAED